MKRVACIILAAGKSSRFKSNTSKVLHNVGGRPMLSYIIDAATKFSDDIYIVVSKDFDQTKIDLAFINNISCNITFVIQENPLGTGQAFKLALDKVDTNTTHIVTLMGDTPLITDKELSSLIDIDIVPDIVILGMRPDDPMRYGRIIEDNNGFIKGIIEYSSATDSEKQINFCNSGILLIKYDLAKNITFEKNTHSNEYQLTDIISNAYNLNKKIVAICGDWKNLIGINTKAELANAEAILQNRYRKKHIDNGTTFIDSSSVFLSFDTIIEDNVTIHPFVIIGNNVRLKEGSKIFSFSSISNAVIGNNSCIGPFASIHDNVSCNENVCVGSFVEVKNSVIDDMSSAKHLAYIGDSNIGKSVNIGAGCVTCNYDGHIKSKTEINDGAFVGSNVSLIAPINIGANSTIGAGSVISHDVPDNNLAISRIKQSNIKLKSNSKHLNRKKKEKSNNV